MKKLLTVFLLFVLFFAFTACTDKAVEEKSLAGTYIGYSWHGENKGESFADSHEKIQTILTLDKEGIITDASMLFWKFSNGTWYTRQDSTTKISVNLTTNPVTATPGKTNYNMGTSMFRIDTHDKLGLYAVASDGKGTVAFLILEPSTRYQYEIKFTPGYDYSTLISALPVDGTAGGFMPTVRASGGGILKPESWSEQSGKNIFNISPYAHVLVDYGTFKGLNKTSTVQELLEAAGVTFSDGKPQELKLTYGRHSNGGWQGNYEKIQAYLIGKNATEMTSLVDWSVEKWAKAINKDNFFGVDVGSGATKTAQNSFDTISGATVRMSRESTSYQRALVSAGILTEDQVIKGRF